MPGSALSLQPTIKIFVIHSNTKNMIENLIICLFFALSVRVLVSKWKLDDYIKTHPRWSYLWPTNFCELCFMYWITFFSFVLINLCPWLIYLFGPLSTIFPVAWLMVKFTNIYDREEE